MKLQYEGIKTIATNVWASKRFIQVNIFLRNWELGNVFQYTAFKKYFEDYKTWEQE